ncbi:MAG: RAMP superfamily CRISPR-associated protein [Dehalococcoidia bacterium]
MHKRLLNECLIDLKITTEGPLLIKSGMHSDDGIDMTPVVTFCRGTAEEPYIPGSSFKGTLRSHAERIARTLSLEESKWQMGACDPFGAAAQLKSGDWERANSAACSAKLQLRKGAEERFTTAQVYKDSCPICKVWGNTFLMGRLAVSDCYLAEGSGSTREQRNQVAIDRQTGAVAGGPFNMYVITGATFETRLKLQNFELWQLGLLAFVLRDLGEGLVPLGMGKSRGLGQVKSQVRQMRIYSVNNRLPSQDYSRLFGIYVMEEETDRQAYGYWEGEKEGVEFPGALAELDDLGIRREFLVEDDALIPLWKEVAKLANQRLSEYEIPETMRHEKLAGLVR